MNRRRAKALKIEGGVYVSFSRTRGQAGDILPCCVCDGDANEWPMDDDPTLFAYGSAEIHTGPNEVITLTYRGEEWPAVPICETCFGSQIDTGSKLLRQVFGDDAGKFGKPFECSEEIAEALMEKPSAGEH
jgi:hypothetical protein